MDNNSFGDVVEQVRNRIPLVKGKGEEATKQALILPIISSLGFDIWNPMEVIPEYAADFAIKKAGQKEKVDYAVIIDGSPRIFIEAKPSDLSLEDQCGQLARYFNSCQTVTLGILTNGVEWWFYSDTLSPNMMDQRPFYVFNVNSKDQSFDVIARFGRDNFSPDSVKSYASELLYTSNIANFLKEEIDLRDGDLSESFIKWVLKSGIYSGPVNQGVIDRFRPIIKTSLSRVIRDIVRRAIISIDENVSSEPVLQQQETTNTRINTTEEELSLFGISKEIWEKSTLPRTIFNPSSGKEEDCIFEYKDTTAYFCLFFNKPLWWFVRVSLGQKTKWIGFNVDPEIGKELIPEGFFLLQGNAFCDFRVSVSGPSDILKLRKLFLLSVKKTVEDRKKTDSKTGD